MVPRRLTLRVIQKPCPKGFLSTVPLLVKLDFDHAIFVDPADLLQSGPKGR